jgi:hypothetical protein
MSTYDFPKQDYWIMAGSALVMHGVRELTGDIDMGCHTILFEKLMEQGHEPILRADGSRSLIIDKNLEVFENWMVEEINDIEGIPVASLLSVLSFKRTMYRDKDIRDIVLIEAFLNSMDDNRRE